MRVNFQCCDIVSINRYIYIYIWRWCTESYVEQYWVFIYLYVCINMDIYCKSFSAYMVSSHMVVMEIVMNALDSIHIKVDSCIDSNTDLSSNNGHNFFYLFSSWFKTIQCFYFNQSIMIETNSLCAVCIYFIINSNYIYFYYFILVSI